MRKLVPIVIFISIVLVLILNPSSYTSFRVNQSESEIGPNSPHLGEFEAMRGNIYHFSFLVNSMDDEIYFQINRSVEDVIYTKVLNNVSLNLFDFTSETNERLSYYVYVNETTGQNGNIVYSYSVTYAPASIIFLIILVFAIIAIGITIMVKIIHLERIGRENIET